jgi:glycosyltransferase involved in cell wall biosynthesis
MENVLYRIAQTLAARHTVELVGLRQGSGRIRERFFIYSPKRETVRLPSPPFLRPLTERVRLLKRFIREREPDLIMAVSGIGINGLSVALVGKLKNLPAIARVTSDVFEVQKYRKPFSKRLRLFLKNNVLGRLAIWLATRTVLLHEVQVEKLTRAGFPASRFFVVPQPISLPIASDRDETPVMIRRRYRIPKNAYLVGAIGRVDQDKNIRLLHDVIKYVLEADARVFFLIVGGGPEKPWLQTRMSNERVIFVDQVPRDRLASYYQACDVTIQTSFSEGLSNAIAESLYFGVPVISTDSGPITRAMVSNIGKTAEELAGFIITRQVKVDPLLPTLREDRNAELWHQLILETLSQN